MQLVCITQVQGLIDNTLVQPVLNILEAAGILTDKGKKDTVMQTKHNFTMTVELPQS